VKLGRLRTSKQKAGKPEAKRRTATESASTSRNKAKEKKKKNDTRQDRFVFSRRAILFWGVSFAVVAIWIFALGVLVGRGLIFHSETYKNLEKRIGEFRSSGPPAVTVAPEPVEDEAVEPKLTFYKSLSSGQIQEDFSSLKKTRPASQPRKLNKTASPSTRAAPQSVSREKSDQKKKAATSSAPAAKNDKSVVLPRPGESSRIEPSSRAIDENYTIQIAAISDRENAEKYITSLRRKGHPAYYYEARNKSGRRYYRVRIGRFKTREEAETAMVRLRKVGHKGMFISRLTE